MTTMREDEMLKRHEEEIKVIQARLDALENKGKPTKKVKVEVTEDTANG